MPVKVSGKKEKQEMINAGKYVEERLHLCTAGGDINRHSHCGKQEAKSRPWGEMCTLMFTAASFVGGQTGKQPECLTMDDG